MSALKLEQGQLEYGQLEQGTAAEQATGAGGCCRTGNWSRGLLQKGPAGCIDKRPPYVKYKYATAGNLPQMVALTASH
ncbi:GH19339 [Drosophila grimshawi]|uniref:GH19339 n=1 Tax=Drosophila grimshawi TaxID=7222 RepID=B4JFK7_DROGR|nr:GH19339 [Drosophila grimshawi]